MRAPRRRPKSSATSRRRPPTTRSSPHGGRLRPARRRRGEAVPGEELRAGATSLKQSRPHPEEPASHRDAGVSKDEGGRRAATWLRRLSRVKFEPAATSSFETLALAQRGQAPQDE